MKCAPLAVCDEDGKGAGPFVHPVHGDAAEERILGAEIECGGVRVIGDEAFFFALVNGEVRAIDRCSGEDLNGEHRQASGGITKAKVLLEKKLSRQNGVREMRSREDCRATQTIHRTPESQRSSLDDFAGGVGAGRAGEAVAGMRAGAAKVEAANGVCSAPSPAPGAW